MHRIHRNVTWKLGKIECLYWRNRHTRLWNSRSDCILQIHVDLSTALMFSTYTTHMWKSFNRKQLISNNFSWLKIRYTLLSIFSRSLKLPQIIRNHDSTSSTYAPKKSLNVNDNVVLDSLPPKYDLISKNKKKHFVENVKKRKIT